MLCLAAVGAKGAPTTTTITPSRPPRPSPQIRTLDSHKLAAAAGPQADCATFVEYIQRNVALSAYRTSLTMSTKSTASYIKTELATALRKNPFQVNLLVGGWDKDTGASLFWIDYLGSMAKMDYAAHGYAGYFLYSTMDANWRPGMDEEAALGLARVCVAELAKRFTIHQPHFKAKLVTAEGTREVVL